MTSLRVILLVGLTVLTGCGGGSDPAPSARETFIARGDRICTDALRAADALPEPQGEAAVARSVRDIARIQSDAVDRFTALTPPRADRPFIARINAQLAEAVRGLEAGAEAARRGQRERLEATVADGRRQSRAINGALRGYGFKRCFSIGPD